MPNKPKVLFISHHREGDTGWSKAARGYIHALKAAGFEVAARAVKLNNGNVKVDETILQAEETVSAGADYLIQHLLPHHMEYSGHFRKCIGIVDLDSSNIEYTGWADRLRLMDEIWVPNTDSKKNLSMERDMPNIEVVPHAFDTSVYTKQYGKIDLNLPENTYKFYTIADLSRRKNLGAMLKAFHLAFPTDYNVALILKVNKSGVSSEDLFNEINSLTVAVKKSLRIYKEVGDYHNEIVIADRSSEEGIYALHQSCDCYVTSSSSEAWCIPAFDAMAFGNRVIATDVGGPRDYLYSGHALVGSRIEPVTGMDGTFDNLFTSRETWANVDVSRLADMMKWAYSEKYTPENRMEKYSYDSVGKLIRSLL